jgi:hypothetical protein
VGTAVPLFALTKGCKELLMERAKEVELLPLMNTMKLTFRAAGAQAAQAAGLKSKNLMVSKRYQWH